MKRRFENLTRGAARAIKHWWLLALAGVLCIALSIVIFAFPLESYVTLAILFGVLLLIVGAAKLIAASTSANFFMMRDSGFRVGDRRRNSPAPVVGSCTCESFRCGNCYSGVAGGHRPHCLRNPLDFIVDETEGNPSEF